MAQYIDLGSVEIHASDPNALLTTAQAAKLLGVDPSTLRRWGASQRPELAGLTPVRLGPRVLRWRRSDVLAWVENQ